MITLERLQLVKVMITQQVLDADPKEIQQIDFNGNFIVKSNTRN